MRNGIAKLLTGTIGPISLNMPANDNHYVDQRLAA